MRREWGGLRLLERLPGEDELEVPLWRARGESGASLVAALLDEAAGGRDRAAALYDRALRLAHVAHPGLPALVESMAPELPEPFLAWEAPIGRTLRSILDDGLPDPTRAARVLLEIVEAVEALHAAGEVHGGLCPANVLLGADGGRVRLLGVGTATTRAPGATLPAAVARRRAPEQLGFVRGAIDPRTDVFAVGALSHELFFGVPAFPAASLDELRAAMAAGPPRPADPSPGDREEPLPEPVLDVLRRALEHDPAERPRTTSELARPLRAWLGARDAEASSAPRGGRAPAAEPAHDRRSAPSRRPPAAPGGETPRPRRRAPGPRRGGDPTGPDAPLPIALWLVPAAVLALVAALLWLWVL
jgi:hypothetical protein